MERGLQAAVRRFPLKVAEIRRLAFADESFRSLCDDLAEAESALGRWTLSSSAQSDVRRLEYQLLVEELFGEIEQMVDRRMGAASASARGDGGDQI